MKDGSLSHRATLQRLRAAAALRGLTLATLAGRCGITAHHLRCVITGERKPSERLTTALKVELGSHAWAFVLGRTDVLAMPGTSVAEELSRQSEEGGA